MVFQSGESFVPIHDQKLIRVCKSVGRRYPSTKPLKNTFASRKKERRFRTAYLREKNKSERKISLVSSLVSSLWHLRQAFGIRDIPVFVIEDSLA